MDPQSVSFTPQSEVWRLSDNMRSMHQTQQEHSERLGRLERRQDEDARIKSVWGSGSPFPGVLSGTPQHGPLQQSSNAEFASFDDDQSNNMFRSLQLDADDEPRRLGPSSRANSVRFDESAKQGQWAHAPRSSSEFLSRAPSALSGAGGHPLFERTTSHKSDGRQSSAGHSASGRANSLGLDTSQLFGQSSLEPPGLAPGLFILGTVPAIIRCWLNTNFKHDTLLYAAVCTGSYRSFLDVRTVNSLGFSGQIRHDISGLSKIKLPVYLPEAIPHPASSRSASPVPQLPSLTVDFTVVDRGEDQTNPKAIQIFLGSDTLRAHNADILFSSNMLTLFDDDRSKLSIPLVRPENDEAFKCLCVTSVPLTAPKFPMNAAPGSASSLGAFKPLPNGVSPVLRQAETTEETAILPDSESAPGMELSKVRTSSISEHASEEDISGETTVIVEESVQDQKPSLNPLNTTKAEAKDSGDESPLLTSSSRTASSPATWGSWRRDSSSGVVDYASASRNAASGYQRPNREQGIKVLKPTSRQSSRSAAAPSSHSTSQSPGAANSRFFDEGRRKTASHHNQLEPADTQPLKKVTSADSSKALGKEAPAAPSSGASSSTGKTRGGNPIGGASAFGWLNSGQQK